MNKSPEEYFQEQDFSVGPVAESGQEPFSPAERAFMEKYMGLSEGSVPELLAERPDVPTAKVADVHEAMQSEQHILTELKEQKFLQMVSFFLGIQEFSVPTIVVQEVIRNIPVAKLPSAPPFVAGVISLRGKVTPLIYLRDFLEVGSARETEDKFIVVCRRKGFQVGLIVERIHTMYRVPQEDVDWNVESALGPNVQYISGLVKIDELLVGIVDVDSIIESL